MSTVHSGSKGGKTTRSGAAVWVSAPRSIDVRHEEVRRPGPGEVTIAASVSLLSPGTELRVYRGEVSPETELGLETCQGSFALPVKYGYQVVGRVDEVGRGVPLERGTRVFARHPHQDLFTMRYDPELLSVLPDQLTSDAAAFSNLMSVALNSLLDVPVRVGEDVVVFGLGPIGLFTSQLASRTASRLWVVDPSASRRKIASDLIGAQALHPDIARSVILDATDGSGVDVVYEVSGAPAALQHALGLLGIEGTICVVAYYGDRPVQLTLAPEFHFKRHRIISSQAGIVGSGLQPRWDRRRRLRMAWDLLATQPVDQLITNRFDIMDAPAAYRLLDAGPDSAFGIVFDHSWEESR